MLFIFYLFVFLLTILYCFCHTLTWIHHGCTWVPNPEPPSHHPPHIISLGHPSAPAPSILYPVSNLDWWFVSLWERERVGWSGRTAWVLFFFLVSLAKGLLVLFRWCFLFPSESLVTYFCSSLFHSFYQFWASFVFLLLVALGVGLGFLFEIFLVSWCRHLLLWTSLLEFLLLHPTVVGRI